MKIASNEIEKMRAKTGAVVNMDKVRKAVEKPTGIPLVIGGQESDSSWQAAAASDHGLAPKAKSQTDDASEPSGEESYQRPSRTLEPRPALTPAEPEMESAYPPPKAARGVPSATPAEEPAYLPSPSRPLRTAPEKSWGGKPAPSRSASGVKTMPYIEGEEEEEQ